MKLRILIVNFLVGVLCFNTFCQSSEQNEKFKISDNSIIVSLVKIAEFPGSIRKSGKFSFGVGYERKLVDRINLRVLGSIRNGYFGFGDFENVGGEMFGHNIKIGIGSIVLKDDKFRLTSGFNYNYEFIKIEGGKYLSEKNLAVLSDWYYEEIFNSIELYFETEYHIIKSFSIYCNFALQYGKLDVGDSLNGDVKYSIFRIPLIENAGLKYRF